MMSEPPDESVEAELDSTAREFLQSQYAGDRFTGWPIDRRLDAYLRRCGSAIANNGTVFGALLERVMANISLARKGPRRPP